jgi:hypothetical protein
VEEALKALAEFARAVQEGREETFTACDITIRSVNDALVAAEVERMARAGLGSKSCG